MAAPKGNKYAIGNNGGRPPYYKTAEALLKECNDYFEYIKGERKTLETTEYDSKKDEFVTTTSEYWERAPEPATIMGLVLYLGFSELSSLTDYERKGQEFAHVLKRARARVVQSYEQRLDGDRPTGAIFALKNIAAWRDKNEIGITDKDGNDITGIIALPTAKLQQIEKLLTPDEDTKSL